MSSENWASRKRTFGDLLTVIGKGRVIQGSGKCGNSLPGKLQANPEFALLFNEAGTISAVNQVFVNKVFIDQLFGSWPEPVPLVRIPEVEAELLASHITHPSGPAVPISG
jgi:hypothetical protein